MGIDSDAPEIEPTWHPFDLKKDQSLKVDTDSPHVDVLGRSTDLERPTLEAEEFATKLDKLDTELSASLTRNHHGDQ